MSLAPPGSPGPLHLDVADLARRPAVTALGANSAVQPPAAEDRPCRRPASRTPEACPERGDRWLPGDHAAGVFAAAVAPFFVSRRLDVAAMAASRARCGGHAPHDAVAGTAPGGPVGFLATRVPRRRPVHVTGRLPVTWPRPPLVSGTA